MTALRFQYNYPSDNRRCNPWKVGNKSRKKDESIIIADHIVITVVEIRGDKVRLGIEAPKEIPVHRQEIHDAIQREEKAQAAVDAAKKTDSKEETTVDDYG